MKYKIKLFKALLLLGTLFLFNCQPEQEVSYQEETTSRKLNIWKYPAERIFKETKAVKDRISILKQKNTEARLTSSLYDFSIEESEVQVIYEATYTQYSFLIYRSIPVANVLENYICKVYNDGYVEQFLVAYPYTEDENGMVYDTQNATMQVIQDNSLINTTASRIPAGCVPEFVDTAWTYECVNVACSGPHSGSHTEPSDCLCGTPEHKYCTPPHTECDWVSVNIWTYSCPNNGGPGDTSGDTGGTGGGGSGTGNSTEDEIITMPVEFKPKNPCDKMKELTSSVAYKQKFKALNTQNNFDLPYETGFGQFGDTYVDGIISTDPEDHSITIPQGSKNGTHVHNNKPAVFTNTGETYDGAIKIQSIEDLAKLIKQYQNNSATPEDAYVIMLSDEGIFALNILEPIVWDNDLGSKLQIFNDYYIDKCRFMIWNYTNTSANSRKAFLEKMFLIGLKDAGLENKIGLLEGAVENENNPDINNYNIKWTRKILKKRFLGQSVDSIPCN